MAVFPHGINVQFVASENAEWHKQLATVAGEQKRFMSSPLYHKTELFKCIENQKHVESLEQPSVLPDMFFPH